MLDKTRNIFIAISVLLTPLAQASEVSTSQAPTQKTVTQQTPQQRLSALLNGYQKACMSEECAKQLIQVKKYGRWGDAKSQLVLANAYLYGDGVEKNTDKAISWLKRAAYNSSANAGKYSQKARHMLAKIYQQGVGVEQDLDLANKHFTTLVEQQYGPVLFDNAFVEFEQDNVVQGIALLEQASASRFAQASYFLGRMYQQGEFVEKDISKAAGYYQKIVKTNYKDSRQRLTDIVDENGS